MSGATSPVFITVPKYVAISPSTTLPKIRPAPVDTPAMSPVSSSGYASSSGLTDDGGAPKGKKRRLDHLSWEEKIQRKKLKNRVAAQTSRDRKKARMEEMEVELKELSQKTEILQNKCVSLQTINDSLLEKNQKLDMEVELLRQQLTELQQHQQASAVNTNTTATSTAPCQTVATCAGCESILNGSAAGLTSDGLTVDTRTAAAEKEQLAGVALEDCCALPSLQDMLLLDDDEEFDAGKLEELAESLLADITADMETGNPTSDASLAETTSGAERLLGSVVGTAAECLESSGHTAHTTPTQSGCLNEGAAAAEEEQTQTNENEHFKDENTECNTFTLQSQYTLNGNANHNVSTASTCSAPPAHTLPSTPDTVYGTYDAKTNSITIVMDDDTVPVNEAVEEIYCDGVAPPLGDDCIKCPSPAASPSQVYLNVECCSDDEDDDLNFDPIAKFLRPKRPLVSPLAKSPALSLYSATSDHGYESIMGSPTSTCTAQFEPNIEDFAWNNSFNELFPTLI